MLRTSAKASSLFRMLAGAASTGRPTLLIPAISPAITAVPHHPNLSAHVIQPSLLFPSALLGKFRGYALDRRGPEEDEDFSDGSGMDSEDFEIGGEDFTGDEEEGITDEDSLDEDAVEDESD